MKPFKFALLLLLQQADDRLRLERLRQRPDPGRLGELRRKKRLIAARLRRAPAQPLAAGS